MGETKNTINNSIPRLLFAHLSTVPQPLIGRLYVICHDEEHLLALQNKIRPRQ